MPIARVDRRIGVKGELRRTWLVASRSRKELGAAQWLDSEQNRWGVENRSPHTLDVTDREDQSRVRHPNATAVLGLCRRLSNAFKPVWAIGRPKREATSPDGIERNSNHRGYLIRLITSPVTP